MTSKHVFKERNQYCLVTVFIYKGTFLSISKVQVCNSRETFLLNFNCVTALGTNIKIKHKDNLKQKLSKLRLLKRLSEILKNYNNDFSKTTRNPGTTNVCFSCRSR